MGYNFLMDMKKLKHIPSSPGIYIMKGAKERIIYVGKAKNLRNRLRSYFQPSSPLDERKLKMIQETRDFDYIVTENELEALVLEANFIKRFRPRFNIILRDDKNYPYLRLSVNEEWPRLEVVRKTENNGSLYFGPYVPAGTMWEILRFIRRNFPLRTCRYSLEKPFRPCVQYQMERCLAPCAESHRTQSDRERYQEIVNEVKFFLRGEKKELLKSLHAHMQRLSDELKFEKAAQIRDRLKTIEKAWDSQRAVAPDLGDMDVIGLCRKDEDASMFMLFIRNGMVIGQRDFFLRKLRGMDDRELVASFIEQFYSKEMLLPSRIIIPIEINLKTQGTWLSKRKGDKVQITYAKEEQEMRVLRMANDNAFYSLSRHKGAIVDEALLSIKSLLNLKAIPEKIGAIDVSNIFGAEAVGALVIWEDGKFVKDQYRLFKIKTVKGIDDFAMIGEVVGRYLKNISGEDKELPQLILIDGGRGQLESAVRAVKPFELPVEIAAIAKAKDEVSATRPEQLSDRIYIPGKSVPIALKPFTAATNLLQKIRDEAHRFAISYHKKLRKKRILESPLERIKGIGKTRRLLLLRHFGSIEAIRNASVDEIASLKGMSRPTAELLKESLKN